LTFSLIVNEREDTHKRTWYTFKDSWMGFLLINKLTRFATF
jgi:hypothetical protein